MRADDLNSSMVLRKFTNVKCLLKSVIKHVKLTRFSPAAGMVNSSTHQVNHLITGRYSMRKLITLNQ